MSNLKNKNSFRSNVYNHDIGKLELNLFKYKPIIIYEGLHTFYLKQTSNILNLKIFLKHHKDVYTDWKIKRDVIERGYDKDKVLSVIEKREEDLNKYIIPQEKNADIIFSILKEYENSVDIDIIIDTKYHFDDFDYLLNDLDYKKDYVGDNIVYHFNKLSKNISFNREILGLKKDMPELFYHESNVEYIGTSGLYILFILYIYLTHIGEI